MNLKELQDLGGFVPVEPVKKEVTWKRTEGDVTFDVHVLQLSAGIMDELIADEQRLMAQKDKTKAKKLREFNALLISSTILIGEKPSEFQPMSYEQAYQLKPGLSRVLRKVAYEVNGMVTTAKEGESADPKG